jgi:hypothetical protein
MNIQLIDGQFSAKDAITIVTQMVDIKIKFQEDKILHSGNEEDIKMRETRIKRLQSELFKIRQMIRESDGTINIQSEIQLSV